MVVLVLFGDLQDFAQFFNELAFPDHSVIVQDFKVVVNKILHLQASAVAFWS